MKRFIAAVISLSLCGIMLTACGNNSETDVTESTVETTSAAETTENTTEETTEETTETEETSETDKEDGETSSGENGSYASIEEFAAADLASIADDTVKASDSNLLAFVKSLEGAQELYLDIEAADGSSAVAVAVSGKNSYIKMSDDASESDATIILKDGMMYMLDNASKTGISTPVDDSAYEETNIEEMLGETNMEDIDEDAEVKTCEVEIDGTVYVFEIAGKSGALFEDGELCAIIPIDGTDSPFIVNAFTKDVPADVFEVPSDYQITDMSEASTAQ